MTRRISTAGWLLLMAAVAGTFCPVMPGRLDLHTMTGSALTIQKLFLNTNLLFVLLAVLRCRPYLRSMVLVRCRDRLGRFVLWQGIRLSAVYTLVFHGVIALRALVSGVPICLDFMGGGFIVFAAVLQIYLVIHLIYTATQRWMLSHCAAAILYCFVLGSWYAFSLEDALFRHWGFWLICNVILGRVLYALAQNREHLV